jgi:hypothetical protein
MTPGSANSASIRHEPYRAAGAVTIGDQGSFGSPRRSRSSVVAALSSSTRLVARYPVATLNIARQGATTAQTTLDCTKYSGCTAKFLSAANPAGCAEIFERGARPKSRNGGR